MPLEPEAQAYIDRLAAMNAPALEKMAPADARAQMREMIPALGEPEAVAAVADRTLPGPVGEIPVRVYTPERAATLPVLVYFHGGGWVIGDIETHDGLCRSLARSSGSLIVSVDYRLAPEHKYPAAVEDAYAATRWVAENAVSLGADPERIAVGGDSAGGNLAAVAALMARERGGPRLTFQLLIYPVTDHSFDTPSYHENAEGCLLRREAMAWFWNQYLSRPEEGKEPHASPLRAPDLSGLPPALVITAEYDPLRDEGEAYARWLEAAGVPVTLTRHDGMIHGFLPQGRAAIDEAGAALAEAFAGAPSRGHAARGNIAP